MKHIENKNGKTQIELKNDSTTWGNYRNATFEIRKGKYSIDRGKTFTEVTGTYTKPTRGVLLTTGETEKNSVLNIYDLAGNESEWTLEGNTSAKFPCINRGGDCYDTGLEDPASSYFEGRSVTSSDDFIAFRPALW